MRVLILLNSRFPTHKAYGLQVLAMARGFAESGADVTVAYPRRSMDEPPHLVGVRFFPYGPLSILIHPWLFPLFRLLGLVGLRQLLEDLKPDFSLVNDPVQAAFLPRPWRVFWDVHDVPDPRRWTRRWLVRRIVRRVQGIVSTSQRKVDRLQGLGVPLPPFVVLPNPVTFDPYVYRSITREQARARCMIGEGKAIVYAGQLYDWKGVDTLIQAAAFLPAMSQIHIVGGMGEDFERCKRAADALPAGSAPILFHGQRPAEDIPSWLRAADVVVIPNSGKHRLSAEDTNPLKAIEAMAAEAVIVASDLPTLRDALAGYPAAVFFRPDDPADFALQTDRLLQNGSKLSSLQNQAKGHQLLTAQARAVSIQALWQRTLAG
jgi:glycosyltransferase involved in cell wall biosynthesis